MIARPRFPALLLVLLLALAPLPAPAQAPARPNTFLNVPWGCSRSEIFRVLADNGVTIPEDVGDVSTGKLELSGGKFAGQEVTTWWLEFVRGKLVGATVVLKAADGNSAALYREIKQQLVKKYGPPPAERKFSTLTADQRNSYLVNGSRPPNFGTAVTWKFLPNLKDKETLSLSCEHAPSPGEDTRDETQYLVTLRYAQESLKARLLTETETVDQSKPRAVQARDL